MDELDRDEWEVTVWPEAEPGQIQYGIKVRHKPSGVTRAVKTHRSQIKNRDEAIRLIIKELGRAYD